MHSITLRESRKSTYLGTHLAVQRRVFPFGRTGCANVIFDPRPCTINTGESSDSHAKPRACCPTSLIFFLSSTHSMCGQTHLPRTTFSHAQSLHRLVLLVVRVYSHTLTSMHLHGSRLKRIFVSHLKTLHPRRAMSCTLQNLTPRTGTPSSPFSRTSLPAF